MKPVHSMFVKQAPNSKRQKQAAEQDTVPEWRTHLTEHGWCVVPNCFEPERYVDEFWAWMESFGTGIERGNSQTWSAANWPHSMHGLIQHFKIGHAPFAWAIRAEPKILEVFALIYGVPASELLASFDGGNLSRPGQSKAWPHLDQGSKSSEFACYQGLAALTSNNGGLCVYDKSHLQHGKFFKKTGINSHGNWYKLSAADQAWYAKQDCDTVLISPPAGSLVLWDSRTVHWGQPPTDVPRLCTYVCYLPRSNATPKQLEKRLAVFAARRMTTHWPYPVRMFSETFQHWGHPELLTRFPARPTIADSQLTPTMRRLIGFAE